MKKFLASKNWKTIALWSEVFIILWWAIFVGQAYFDFDINAWPLGSDYPLTIQSHFMWRLLSECGSCVFWNGFINGGNPSFVETHGAFLHPFTILTTLLFGALNGTKITMLLALLTAGLAQWRLAYEMKVGFISRMWISLLAIIGGHLAGRMEAGLIGIVLSTAMGSLVLLAAWKLVHTFERKHAVLLGISISLVLLSGQGYIQLSTIIFAATIAIIFSWKNLRSLQPNWELFGWAALVSLLLTGVFLVPLLHFLPNFSKPFVEPYLYGQPWQYQPLNLIIADFEFYAQDSLGKIPFPAVFMAYIGWMPIVAALIAVYFWPRKRKRELFFFVIPILFIFAASSKEFGTALANILGDPQFLRQLRYPSLMIGFAVPLILGLAAWGADKLWNTTAFNFKLDFNPENIIVVPVARIALLIMLTSNLLAVYDFSDNWLILNEKPADLNTLTQALPSTDARWIEPTFDSFWTVYFMDAQLKGTNLTRPWSWHERENPPAQIQAFRSGDSNTTGQPIIQVGDISFNTLPSLPYAYVKTPTEIIPCTAQSKGGKIDVQCETNAGGTLIIFENMWYGWQVRRDSIAVDFQTNPDNWMQIKAPEGLHTYEIRYRPWDVPLGAAVSLLGVALSVWLWRHPKKQLDPA